MAQEALSRARAERKQVLLVDTAGRLQIDEPMMDELRALKDELQPQEILLVADAMTGQEAVNIAQGFDEALELSGVILTKMDGDARGGAALSIHGVTGKPIKFVGVGEGVDALDSADPQRLAGRILQMGDVVGLVERAQAAMDVDEQARLEAEGPREGPFHSRGFSHHAEAGPAHGPSGTVGEAHPRARGEASHRRRGSEEDEAHRSHHPLHDSPGEKEARDPERIPKGSDRARVVGGRFRK